MSIVLAVAILASAGACARARPLPPPGAVDADKFLISRGVESLTERRWSEAREYFQRLVDTYPQSTFRYDAKLGIGDSYLGETSIQSDILGANEFREFLTFYPLHERADYAQFRLAVSQQRQMLSPQRDQSATVEALREFDIFIERYPDSQLMPEAREARREVRDRLSRHEFEVGLSYFRMKWWPGALLRLRDLLQADPNYTGRHEVLFYLGETHFRANTPQEALPYFEELVATYANSPHADNARKRIEEIKR